jgi:hypothetical protein
MPPFFETSQSVIGNHGKSSSGAVLANKVNGERQMEFCVCHAFAIGRHSKALPRLENFQNMSRDVVASFVMSYII